MSTLVAKGTKLALNNERQGKHTGEFEQQTIGDQSWQTHRCQGWQESEATATFGTFTHGTTIKYTAGFVQYQTTKTTTAYNNGISTIDQDFEFVVLEQAGSLAFAASVLLAAVAAGSF